MKTIVLTRLKKWTFFALIGCLAYFVGYIVGHKSISSEVNTPPPEIVSPAEAGK